MKYVSILLWLFSFEASAIIRFGNGGDYVLCRAAENQFSGRLFLDYVVAYDEFGGAATQLSPDMNWEQQKIRISHFLAVTNPALNASFLDFVAYTKNLYDQSLPRIWIQNSPVLTQIRDESLNQTLPENCLDAQGQGQLEQGIIRHKVASQIFYEYSGFPS
jgi:hypothetical protein